MPMTSLGRSDRGLAGSGSTRTSVPSGKFASGGRNTVPFETAKPITTPRLSTRVHYTFNPSLFPSEAGAVTRCRGGKGRRRVKLRTLKDGHRK